MTLEEKYKSLYGRNPRKDWDVDKILEKIKEKETDFEAELPADVKEEVVEAPKKEEVKEAPKVEVVKKGKEAPVSKGVGHTKQYRVYWMGAERYWTAPVIAQALKTKPDAIQFPENTDYVANGSINKCKSC